MPELTRLPPSKILQELGFGTGGSKPYTLDYQQLTIRSLLDEIAELLDGGVKERVTDQAITVIDRITELEPTLITLLSFNSKMIMPEKTIF